MDRVAGQGKSRWMGGVIAASAILIAFAILAAAAFFLMPSGEGDGRAERSYQDRVGAVFLEAPTDPYRAPSVRSIAIPDFPGASAIWGATGRDDRGHIWFGVSAVAGDYSAHLFEFDPETGELFDRGDVLTNLRKAGILRAGEHQAKIHSRIIQADDGYIYFSSMDEEGEDEEQGINPKWGSHLWRLRPGSDSWEHLHQVPEGLVAVAGAGRWIYALGYWDHVLYQYDTKTGWVRNTTIGSVSGHVSRQLIVDDRGHVFVPRLRDNHDHGTLDAELVELDTGLGIVAATPLDHYVDASWPAGSHGIIGFTYLADRSIIAATHKGFLYRIIPAELAPSVVQPLGWFHPSGSAYSPSIFSFAGERYLVGQARPPGGKRDWVTFDLGTGISKAGEFPVVQQGLLYGTNTRDRQGNFYVVGRIAAGPDEERLAPILLQISQN